jgi:hypothetical protein
MTTRSLLASPWMWISAALVAVAMVFGCSSSSGSPSSTGQDASSGSDANGAAETSSEGSSASDASHPGEGGSDGGLSPDALYGCAVTGSFGWPCTATTSGADPTDCTDPSYPDCFVGGQGAWCTKVCAGNGDCTALEDAGCAPASCNARGYCK